MYYLYTYINKNELCVCLGKPSFRDYFVFSENNW